MLGGGGKTKKKKNGGARKRSRGGGAIKETGVIGACWSCVYFSLVLLVGSVYQRICIEIAKKKKKSGEVAMR
jgi:hypothetical protein